MVCLVLVVFALSGCYRQPQPMGIPLRQKPRFAAEWGTYTKLPGRKSLAVAGDPDGIYVSGVAYDHRHEETAIEAALRYCEERRADRNIEPPCRTYAIGNERVPDNVPATR